MSERWRELVECADTVVTEEMDLLNRQLDSCLLAMLRYLLETDREKSQLVDSRDSCSPHPTCSVRHWVSVIFLRGVEVVELGEVTDESGRIER